MTTKIKSILISLIILSLIFSCKKGPKVIEVTNGEYKQIENSNTDQNDPAIQSENGLTFSEDLHTVVINKKLSGSKYDYLYVKENQENFWIAIQKKEIIVGDTYYYKGGLLKTNFESKELNKLFDKIYLVTNLVGKNHSNTSISTDNSKMNFEQVASTKENIPMHTNKIIEHKGSMKIADLVKNYKKYTGKTVQISGECVKINPNIMGRNWIHLKDGSKNDYDLVITSNSYVKEGSIITIKAVVTANKDFGAGYSYDLILEDGELIN
jgi:hypothetical protein